MKNLIRGEDGVGCSVKGTACLICSSYAWTENSGGVSLHVDHGNLFFWNEKLENMRDQNKVTGQGAVLVRKNRSVSFT